MKLVISLDVEEEVLFSGQYPRDPAVSNVAELSRLEFIPRDFGFPLTLLTSYPVAWDPAACQILGRWRDLYGAEIGLHLHSWSTPPFADLADLGPRSAEMLPTSLLRDKLARLVEQVQDFLGVTPVSFRMGRFDLGSRIMSLLPEFDLRVDSSVLPLILKGGGDYFWLRPIHFV